jgi:hypothetical protein
VLATVVETGAAGSERSTDLLASLAAVRERWAQLTFYLLDAESWR